MQVHLKKNQKTNHTVKCWSAHEETKDLDAKYYRSCHQKNIQTRKQKLAHFKN